MPGHIGATKKKAIVVYAAAILLITLAAYANSFNAPFEFDDFHQIVYNHNIRDFSKTPLLFVDPSRESAYTQVRGYRPVTLATFALNYAAERLDVTGYHVFNVILHIINALLVFVAVTAVLRRAGRQDAVPLAGFIALLFAVHPIQTQAVTYVSGRAVLLAVFFYLLGFISFMRFRESGGAPVYARYAYAAAALVCYMLGLLSKQMAVSLPAAMLVYDLVFTVQGGSGPSGSRRTFAWYIPVVLVFLAYDSIARLLSYNVVEASLERPVGTYLLSEARALLIYLRLLVLPINQCPDHNLSPTLNVGPAVFISVALVAACAYLLYRTARKTPEITFFGAWFFLTLAPESTFIPIPDILQEYRLYLPSVGFIAVIAVLLSGLLKNRVFRSAAGALLVTALVLLTLNRNAVWANPHDLWADAVQKSENPWRAHMGIAKALAYERRFPEAIEEYKKSIQPDNFMPYVVYNNLGLCYYEMGRLDEALEQFKRLMKAYPDYTAGLENLGMVSFDMGRYEEAAAAFEEQNRRTLGNPVAHYHLGITYLVLGRDKDAQAELEGAISYGLDGFDVHYNLALALEKQGMMDGALKEARAATGRASDEEEYSQADELLERLEGRRR